VEVVGALLGFDTRGEPHFELLDEQVNRLVASVDAAAKGAAMLLGLYLNERAYLISLLATIFAPLTFLTGFFGMNFGWMTDQIDPDRVLAGWDRRSDRAGCAGSVGARFLMGDARRPGPPAERSAVWLCLDAPGGYSVQERGVVALGLVGIRLGEGGRRAIEDV
jgi:CorA-like Mg2+ transporter protein